MQLQAYRQDDGRGTAVECNAQSFRFLLTFEEKGALTILPSHSGFIYKAYETLHRCYNTYLCPGPQHDMRFNLKLRQLVLPLAVCLSFIVRYNPIYVIGLCPA